MATTTHVTVLDLDHIVLKCTDIDTTLTWYTEQLGLAPVRVDEWRQGTAPFPSVRVNGHTIIDLINGDTSPGRLDHLCLVVAPADLDELARRGPFDVIEGPCTRFGAQGNGTSLYIRDPDGTTVELRYYSQ
jgi:catechol 2,3-dioxygenase-like lactoylglutathione lyase family enzyme